MIRHCVFVRFRNDVTDDERAAIHADLEALRSVIDGMAKVEIQRQCQPRTVRARLHARLHHRLPRCRRTRRLSGA
nr:Dabb family protein [Mesorhizobium sp.]